MILVTGAAGHVGNVVVRELAANGHPVRAMVRSARQTLPDMPSGVTYVQADISRPDTLAAALDGVSGVIHSAAVLPTLGQPDADVERVNVQGTRDLLDASERAGVKRFVYVSSVMSFTPTAAGEFNEACALELGSPHIYHRTKAEGAQLTLERTGLSPVVVAPTGVIGPFDLKGSAVGASVRNWARSPLAVVVPGGTDQVDVRDVARGIRLALERGQAGSSYLLGGQYVPMRDLAAGAQRANGRKARVWALPLGLAYSAARQGVKKAEKTGKAADLTPYALDILQIPMRVPSEPARRELGYTTRPLDETLRDTVAWWNANGAR